MLSATTYHQKTRDYFKSSTKTWDFFAQSKTKEVEWEAFKINLLKNAYRMQPETESALYQQLEQVKQKLQIDIPVILYQLQNIVDLNAFISYQPGEAHLVFSGQILKLLNNQELSALIGHELSHLKLFLLDDGDYEITNRIIGSIAADSRSEDAHLETARYFRLYTEIFCDRGSLLTAENLEVAQAALIKLHSGLENVSVANYLAQVKEILQKNDDTKAEQDTHPENFIRVLALSLWNNNPETAELEISKMIELNFDLNKLDIFQQQQTAKLTEELLQTCMEPGWLQTGATMAVCRQYFNSFTTKSAGEKQWNKYLDKFKPNVKEYFSYVLLDIALADPELENVPLGHAFTIAENMGLKDAFNEVLKKEKKLSDKRLKDLQKNALEALSKAS